MIFNFFPMCDSVIGHRHIITTHRYTSVVVCTLVDSCLSDVLLLVWTRLYIECGYSAVREQINSRERKEKLDGKIEHDQALVSAKRKVGRCNEREKCTRSLHGEEKIESLRTQNRAELGLKSARKAGLWLQLNQTLASTRKV